MSVKNLVLSVAAAATVAASAPAYARYVGPLLSKTAASGFVPPQWAYSTTCEIYADRVVVKRNFGRGGDSGSAGFTETRKIETEGEIYQLIEKAAQETATETPAPCDGPTSRVQAYKILPTDAVETVVLDFSGACSAPAVTRDGSASHILKRFVDSLCPAQ